VFDAFIKEANNLLSVSNRIHASELYCWRHHDETLSQNDEAENEWQRADDKATIRFSFSSFKCVFESLVLQRCHHARDEDKEDSNSVMSDTAIVVILDSTNQDYNGRDCIPEKQDTETA
jgi:predicted metal-dependent HD superfamily phosphohydrolase